jgi:hypothetical protein
MLDVIDLLERMGEDAQLRHASQSAVEQALLGAQIDPELKTAILAKDQRRLELLLGASTVCCAQEAEEDDDDDDDDNEESPSRDGEQMRSQSAFRLAAAVS